MWWSVTSISIIFITVLAASPTKQSASFVFTDFINTSGWNSKGIAFHTGMLGAKWGFANLDAVTHMADEIPDPRKNIPRVLMATVLARIGVSFPYAVGLMFSIQSVEDIVSTPTGVPSLALFRQVLDNDAKAIDLQCLIMIAFIGAIQGVHTWQSRVTWAFARDREWPFSRKLQQIAPAPFETPFWAHMWSVGAVAILGCLYLGSSVALNSFIGSAILFQYLSYSICIILLLAHGRSNIKHGPFWYPKLGLLANLVALVWTGVTLVFCCFPTAYPTTGATMNYASCVIVFIFLYAGFYWAVWGRKTFTLPRERLQKF
jgi:choline transport protein